MRVLVAVDLQGSGEQIVEKAGEWVKRMGARVDLVYVSTWAVAPMFVDEPAVNIVMDQHFDEARQAARQTLERWMAHLPEAQRGEARVLEGNPGRTVAALAEQYDAVIVGTHGRSGLNHLFMGSVAERVVRFSPVPVLVLRIEAP